MAANATKRNVLIIAGVLGLISGLLIVRFLQTVKTANEEKLVSMAVAVREIPARTIIVPGMLSSKVVPVSETPSPDVLTPEEAVGKVALIAVAAGSPIKATDVAAKGVSLGLSYAIPPSMRAVTVAVDPVIGVAGFLKAGDHVDVVATFTRGMGGAVAKTVLQDVQLLALGSQLEKEPMEQNADSTTLRRGTDTATLLVTPVEAERLALAENEGKLRLSLRGAGDVVKSATNGVTSQAVMGFDPKANAVSVNERPSPAPQAPVYSWPPPAYNPRASLARVQPVGKARRARSASQAYEIEVIRGTDVETVRIDGDAGTKK